MAEVWSVDADVLQGAVVEPGQFPVGLPGFVPAAYPLPAIRYGESQFGAGRFVDSNGLESFHRCIPFFSRCAADILKANRAVHSACCAETH
jgi:hypothetical protein